MNDLVWNQIAKSTLSLTSWFTVFKVLVSRRHCVK